jgi:hypothetical protein
VIKTSAIDHTTVCTVSEMLFPIMNSVIDPKIVAKFRIDPQVIFTVPVMITIPDWSTPSIQISNDRLCPDNVHVDTEIHVSPAGMISERVTPVAIFTPEFP